MYKDVSLLCCSIKHSSNWSNDMFNLPLCLYKLKIFGIEGLKIFVCFVKRAYLCGRIRLMPSKTNEDSVFSSSEETHYRRVSTVAVLNPDS